jgi:hypothetical protein
VSDGTPILLLLDRVMVGSGKNLYILGDHNIETLTLFEGVTPPDDWKTHRYLFDGEAWTQNPVWEAPTP